MTAKSADIRSNLKQIDAHTLSAAEYEEIPELSQDFFKHADLYCGETLVRRGRPKLPVIKRQLTVRYDADVISAFKATGKGWQSRMNDALREWLDQHSVR